MSPQRDGVGRLLVRARDRPGIVAAVSGFLYARGANVEQSAQHTTDPVGGHFHLRMVFALDGLEAQHGELERAFAAEVAEPFGLDWRLTLAARPKRVALFVSRLDHCLLDLLWQARRGVLADVEVVRVISNHPDLADEVAAFDVAFDHVPMTRESKPAAEARQLELLDGAVDLVVLARYMQNLSGDFLTRVGVPVINIHHSFLPAFAGAGPHARARERGVKLVGATAHYATEELDAGPIIEQDVVRVTHADDVAELERLGADIERTVLARAVRWHAQDRVLVDGARTVVFR